MTVQNVFLFSSCKTRHKFSVPSIFQLVMFSAPKGIAQGMPFEELSDKLKTENLSYGTQIVLVSTLCLAKAS